jgi:hypothetical protein
VIVHLRNRQTIVHVGSRETKGALDTLLVNSGLYQLVVGVETKDTVTDCQLAAKVRDHYRAAIATR